MRQRYRLTLPVISGLFLSLAMTFAADPPAGSVRKAQPVAESKPAKAGTDLLLQMAYAAYESGNMGLAVEKLDAAEKAKQSLAECANLRGAIFLRGGPYPKAVEQFKRAVNLDPGFWVARFNVAEVPFRQKDFPAARKAFENLAFETDRYKQDKEWELVQYKLIVCDLLTGDAVDAQKRFTRLRSNPASTAKIFSQAAMSFAKNDAASANKVLGLAGTPGSPGLKAIYADALVAAGWLAPPASAGSANVASAGSRGSLRVRGLPVPLLPPALEVDLPKGASPALSADSAVPVDEPSLPLSPAESAAPTSKSPPAKSDTAPTNAVPPKDSSEVAPRTDWRFAKGEDSAPRWIRAANDTAEAYATKLREAQLKLKSKDFDGASQLLEEAAALAPNPAEALNLRGALEYYRGNYRAAESLFRKALVADPGSWTAKFNISEISFVQKEYTRARAQYEEMLPTTNAGKQPVERDLLQYKIFLTQLLEGRTAAAEKSAERLSLGGPTPARYYAQVALNISRKRLDKAAQDLAAAEQSYPASLNFIFAQPLEKLAMLPLGADPSTALAAAPPAESRPEPRPTPKDEPQARADLLPPPTSEATPAADPGETVLARTEAQLLEEIVGGRTPGPPAKSPPTDSPLAASSPSASSPAAPLSTPAPKPAPTPVAVVPTPTPVAAEISSTPVAEVPAKKPAATSEAEASKGWLASALQWLVPGSAPTRMETLLFALALANLFGLFYLLASDVIARLFRPRAMSIHTAGAVGVSVNRLRIIERLRVRLSIANMTRHSRTVGHMDTIVEAPDGTKRAFHWNTLCLNPSGSASSFEEMEVFPLVMLPGEVASLYVDFVADAEETPTPWRRGRHQLTVMGWTEAATKRTKPDFKVSFPLEIPNIPWKHQDIVVDLAIVRPGRKEKIPSEFEMLEWEEEEIEPLTPAAHEVGSEPPAESSPPPPVAQPPPPSVAMARPVAPSAAEPSATSPSDPVDASSLVDKVTPPVASAPAANEAPLERVPAIIPANPSTSGQVRPVTPIVPPPAATRPNSDPATLPARPPLSRTPFLSGPGKTTITPRILPTIGRPGSMNSTKPVGPLVPMVKPIPRPALRPNEPPTSVQKSANKVEAPATTPELPLLKEDAPARTKVQDPLEPPSKS